MGGGDRPGQVDMWVHRTHSRPHAHKQGWLLAVLDQLLHFLLTGWVLDG